MEQLINHSYNENKINIREKTAPIGLIILSGFSFIPAIGVIFGFISIAISLFDFKRLKIIFILGLSGIIFTIVIYSSLYYVGFHMKDGPFNQLRVQMSQNILNEIDREISVYKHAYGTYPNNLKDLTKVNINLTFKDPILPYIKGYKGDSLFYYSLTTDSFKLFSIGLDGKPFTKDDIYPRNIFVINK